jgi:hypothetical protein
MKWVKLLVFTGLSFEVVRLYRERGRLLQEKAGAYTAIRDLAGEIILFVRGESSHADLQLIAEESLDLAMGATNTA